MRGTYPCVGKIPWRRKWQLTPVLFPGESHGYSLIGYSPWGPKESDTTERLPFLSSTSWRRCPRGRPLRGGGDGGPSWGGLAARSPEPAASAPARSPPPELGLAACCQERPRPARPVGEDARAPPQPIRTDPPGPGWVFLGETEAQGAGRRSQGPPGPRGPQEFWRLCFSGVSSPASFQP